MRINKYLINIQFPMLALVAFYNANIYYKKRIGTVNGKQVNWISKISYQRPFDGHVN